MHIAIVGAGPIGLEAALAAVECGHTISVLERGRVAASIRDWGHVRLFSPFGMNASERGRAVLRESGGTVPGDDELLTGREYVDRYLVPLAAAPPLRDSLRERTTVIAIGRTSLRKGDSIGQPERAADGFRLLLRDEDGERSESADVVLDCSGTYPNHRWLGAGGCPCPGELPLADAIEYGLPDVLGGERDRFAGWTTLVVGSGYSAATTIVALGRLAEETAGTNAIWVTRGGADTPLPRIENDTLAERDALARRANELAAAGGVVRRYPDHSVATIGDNGADGFVLWLRDNGTGGVERIECDNVVANVGYRPDNSIHRELQVHECYATEGPMKLAATLQGQGTGDCLAMPAAGPETLRNPEPNYFVLGSKSYGRDSRFLLRNGLGQIDDVMRMLG